MGLHENEIQIKLDEALENKVVIQKHSLNLLCVNHLRNFHKSACI